MAWHGSFALRKTHSRQHIHYTYTYVRVSLPLMQSSSLFIQTFHKQSSHTTKAHMIGNAGENLHVGEAGHVQTNKHEIRLMCFARTPLLQHELLTY